MKNWKNAARCAAMMLMVAAAMLFPEVVKAEGESFNIPSEKIYFLAAEEISENWTLRGVETLKDVSKLKSSNKKVAAVEKFEYDGMVYIGVTAKKPGKTTISFTAKVEGSKRKYKCVATVKKYKTPFSSFKIGSTNVAKKLKKLSGVDIKLKKTLKNQKISFKLKSGWTLGWAAYYNTKDGQNFKEVKSGSKITLKKNKQIQLSLNNKDGSHLDIFVRFY